MSIIEWLLKQDVQINQRFNGLASERISDRCWRLRTFQPYIILRPVIDGFFALWGTPNHCKRSYDKHKSDYPLYDEPPEVTE